MNVTVYVNGKRVTKEELGNYEIHSESLDRIVAEMRKKEGEKRKNERVFI